MNETISFGNLQIPDVTLVGVKRVREISGISKFDKREVKESVMKELERKSKDYSGKSMTPAEFSRWCDSL